MPGSPEGERWTYFGLISVWTLEADSVFKIGLVKCYKTSSPVATTSTALISIFTRTSGILKPPPGLWYILSVAQLMLLTHPSPRLCINTGQLSKSEHKLHDGWVKWQLFSGAAGETAPSALWKAAEAAENTLWIYPPELAVWKTLVRSDSCGRGGMLPHLMIPFSF